MSTFPFAAGLQFPTTSAPLNVDYSKVEQVDQPILKQWLELKEKISKINMLPRSKTAQRRQQAIELLGEAAKNFEKFIQKYNLYQEYFQLTTELSQYLNSQIQPLENAATVYFQGLFQKNHLTINKELEFFPKKGGDQLGRQVRIEYLEKNSKEQRTIDYFIKTHQGGAKSGQSSVRQVDPKELFVYKVLEYTGLGPEVHFFFNHLSQGGFYIATQDCGFSESAKNKENRQFMTLGALKEKQEMAPKTTNKLIAQMDNIIYCGFACADIFSRIFYLRDILTNSGNSGFVLDNGQCEFKIIDFSVIDVQGSYFSESICAGYLSGNGMFNYLNDNFLKKYLKDIQNLEKVKIAQKVQEKLFSRVENYLSLQEAIDKAASDVFEFVNKNYLNLGINKIPKEDSEHDFNRYVREVKSNYDKFSQDLNKQLLASLQEQVTQPQSGPSVRTLDSQRLPLPNIIQQQKHKPMRSFNLCFVDNAKESLIKDESKKWRGILQDKEIFFEEHQIIRDGSCGFHTIGAERKNVVEVLLGHANNSNIRKELALEIETAFRSGESNAITDDAKKLFEEQRQLSDLVDDLQRRANEVIKKEDAGVKSKNLTELLNYFRNPANNQNPKLLDELEGVNKASEEIQSRIVAHVSSEPVYTAYVKSLEEREWLGIYSAKIYAFLKNINLYIWIKGELNSGIVTLKESNVASNNQNTIHMLYTDGGTHFNLLSEVEHDPKVVQSNAGYKESYERDSKDRKETKEVQESEALSFKLNDNQISEQVARTSAVADKRSASLSMHFSELPSSKPVVDVSNSVTVPAPLNASAVRPSLSSCSSSSSNSTPNTPENFSRPEIASSVNTVLTTGAPILSSFGLNASSVPVLNAARVTVPNNVPSNNTPVSKK